MSGHHKKGKKSETRKGKSSNLGDVTLADYANSSVALGKGRLSKVKTTFSVVKEVKQLNIEDKSWDQKLEDFEGDFDFVKEENEDGEEVFIMRKTPRRKKTLSESIAENKIKGNTYSLDIWHLIAEFIRPEDIGTFSLICKSSWCVVNSPTFWFNLYKRHYKPVPNLPARLKPECMVRHHSLKACVVRALFYMYPPFASRVDRKNISTPYDLRSRQCISVWQERHSKKWMLCFKLRRVDCQSKKGSSEEKPDLMEILGDIFANADDGCAILQVMSAEKTILPVVMGLYLHNINISLDLTMAHMQVGLVFGSGRVCNGRLDSTCSISLSLRSVKQVRVLDWWHPQYPHSLNTIRPSSEDT